jgi:DNA-binding NarL/FixJ family response regulator
VPIRVLLCDDVEAFRALMRVSLSEDPGIEVVGEACNGEEGVAQVRDLQPDVVLLDLAMPVLDGLEAIPRMRRFAPRARVVAFSGFEAVRMRARVIAEGADAYLEKGVDLSEVRAAIHQAAEHPA